MKNYEVAQWLRVTGKRLAPMRSLLDGVALLIDENYEAGKEVRQEMAETVQGIAHYVLAEINEAEKAGTQAPDCKEYQALTHAIVFLLPNTIQADFTRREDKALQTVS